MEQLFTKYSVSEIIIFVIFLAIAVKEFVCFVDWTKDRIRQTYDKNNKFNNKEKELEERIGNLEKTIQSINSRIDILIESDKEDIKSFITREHHYFVYEVKWIDDYTLNCIEKRFKVYENERGNSFIKGLMNEIRALPKQPPHDYKEKYNETARYVSNAKQSK